MQIDVVPAACDAGLRAAHAPSTCCGTNGRFGLVKLGLELVDSCGGATSANAGVLRALVPY